MRDKPSISSSLLLIAITISTILLTVRPASAFPPHEHTIQAVSCPALPFPGPGAIIVSSEPQLQNAIANLSSGQTILISDGTYDLSQTLVVDGGVQNVAIRGASGNPDAVVLKGKGMANPNYGDIPHGFLIRDASYVQIADLTIRDAYYHNIQVQGEQGAHDIHLYDLHLIDSGEQFIKGSTAGPPGPYADSGIVECSTIEYSDRARSDYTNGVDILAGADWIIRDNIFRNIRAPEGQLAGPAVLLWRNSLNTIVERNLFLECDRAIALGLSAPDANSRDGETVYDHQGGIIRNNMIYREGVGDVGITVNYARDVQILHNTVILNGTFPWGAIEYRFPPTSAEIRNNLTDAPLWERDGAVAVLSGNLTTALPGLFVNPTQGDLHLRESAANAIDEVPLLVEASDDFDREPRPVGSAADIGADEYGSAPPGVVLDLHLTNGFTSTANLTVNLIWTQPQDADSTDIRYSETAINQNNWGTAEVLFSGAITGSGNYTGTLPYTGETVFFALKNWNDGGWSELSNNAIWPHMEINLPLIGKDQS
jgi:hypothetical protein